MKQEGLIQAHSGARVKQADIDILSLKRTKRWKRTMTHKMEIIVHMHMHCQESRGDENEDHTIVWPPAAVRGAGGGI